MKIPILLKSGKTISLDREEILELKNIINSNDFIDRHLVMDNPNQLLFSFLNTNSHKLPNGNKYEVKN